jgi:hypothetical protein
MRTIMGNKLNINPLKQVQVVIFLEAIYLIWIFLIQTHLLRLDKQSLHKEKEGRWVHSKLPKNFQPNSNRDRKMFKSISEQLKIKKLIGIRHQTSMTWKFLIGLAVHLWRIQWEFCYAP